MIPSQVLFDTTYTSNAAGPHSVMMRLFAYYACSSAVRAAVAILGTARMYVVVHSRELFVYRVRNLRRSECQSGASWVQVQVIRFEGGTAHTLTFLVRYQASHRVTLDLHRSLALGSRHLLVVSDNRTFRLISVDPASQNVALCQRNMPRDHTC